MGEKLDKDGFEYLKIFVGGLNLETDNERLKEYFGTYGELKDARVITEKDYSRPSAKPKSKGYGFVTFTTEEGYEKCLKENPHTIDAKLVEVKKAEPARSTVKNTWKTKKVFVGGVHESCTKEDIEEAIEKLGFKDDLDKAKIMTEKDTERPRGFAFVMMNSCEAADKLARLRHITVKDREVEVKHAIPKEDMEDKRRGNEGRQSGRSDQYGGGSPDFYGRGSFYGDDPYGRRGDDYGYGYGRYPAPRGYFSDRMMPAYPYEGSYPSRYAGGSYGDMYGGYGGSYGYGPAAASSMGSYSQSSSMYGPTKGREKSYSYHPYSKR